MSTAFDPTPQVALPHRAAAPHVNGKAPAPLSMAAARPGFWRRGAPQDLRSRPTSPDEAWGLYWNDRVAKPSLVQLCRAGTPPLSWAPIPDATSPPTDELLAQLAAAPRWRRLRKPRHAQEKHRLQTTLSRWLFHAPSSEPGYDLALGSLAAVHLLGEAGGALEPALAWKALDLLAEAAAHACSWAPPEGVADAAVAQQVLAGELPLTLAYYFSEMAPLHELARGAVERLSAGLDELLNGEGLPRAEHLVAMRPLLACWTRCRAVGSQIKEGRWGKKNRRQYSALVRQCLRWTDAEGRLPLAGGGDQAWRHELLPAALEAGGSKKNRAAARASGAAGKSRSKRRSQPPASDCCEWSRLALMRSGWKSDAALIAVDFSTPLLRLDAWAGGRPLLGGVWEFETRVDGAVRRPAGSWDELCWFADNDVDYLELSLPLEDGAWLERQILLAHKDKFLLLADHVKQQQPGALEHAWQLPLGASLLFCGEGETRDALLVDGAPLARVVPLALPEWRIDPRVGELSTHGGGLRLAQRAAGRTLACPVFIDFDPQRAVAPSTWRQLTVAESLEILPADAAVSYRVQADRDQWVFYRSQGRRGNRTFLGQNTSSELLAARFKAPAGKIETLLEIEG